ncbi:MAG: SOS response-associated peptidase family protein [Cyclobacteriaceae bacterium]
MTKRAAEYAKRYGKTKDWEYFKQKHPDIYHVSGFVEPILPVVTGQDPDEVQPLIWHPACFFKGYNTLNARDDKLLTSRFWKKDFESRRCLVMIDGFYDFHDHGGKKFPFFVQMQSGEPFMIAGLYRTVNISGEERETVTLITTRANKEMAWLHNEPAYSPESRMMYVVNPNDDEEWLTGNWEQAKELIKPLPDGELQYHSCHKLRGKAYKGNLSEVSDKVYYPELEESQGSLF